MLILIIAAGVSFIGYHSLNLYGTGPWQLDLIKYEDRSRSEDWNKIIEHENDPFVTKVYGSRERLIKDMELYSYSNLPAYLSYKVFHLRGARLWLVQRFVMSCLGICAVLLIFLIADLFYGPLVGLVSSILMAFSPHIWITYNFDGAVTRAYNLLLSLLVTYLFLLFMKKRKWYIAFFCGLVMGINFQFFHVGSFMIPIVIFIFCIYSAFVEKKKFYPIRKGPFRKSGDDRGDYKEVGVEFKAPSRFSNGVYYLGYFLLIIFIAILSTFVLNYLHSVYFKLPVISVYTTWFQNYFSKGAEASHSVEGIVFLSLSRLVLNIWQHVQGVFINGKNSDWHFTISPPGIPMIYNYLISIFFAVGCFIAIRYRRREDVFFFLWFSTFFIIYSLIIVVRQKNIMWEIPPIFILSARSVPIVASFLHKKIKTILKKKLINSLCVLLVVSSISAGSFIIFYHLPKKNFYDGGGCMGNYQVYKYLSKKGYSDRTKIIFTMPEVVVANMMLRLFTEKVPQIINLSQWGVPYPPDNNKWLEIESTLKKDSDKIFYCFTYYDNLMGHIYITDEHYRDVFKKIHPEAVPFIIKGLDGKALWRIYEITD